jgi:hypothetical protein
VHEVEDDAEELDGHQEQQQRDERSAQPVDVAGVDLHRGDDREDERHHDVLTVLSCE